MVHRDEEAGLSWASERHLRIDFGGSDPGAPERTHERVRDAVATLQKEKIPGLLDIAPAYSTILLEFTLLELDGQRIIDAVRRALAIAVHTPAPAPQQIIEIPVCYEGPYAPDLDDLARLHGLDISAVIHLHTSPVYTVQFVGFAPGFGYLSGLPVELATLRLDTPRVRVPPGSVGIAEQQTGVYPASTPGGWRLIGRTPLVMFEATRQRPSLLAAGDRVRFVPIARTDFEARMRAQDGHE